VQPYRRSWLLTVLFVLLCILSVGALPLMCYWYPRIYLLLTHRKSDNKKATAILSHSTLTKQYEISYLKTIVLEQYQQRWRAYEYRNALFVYSTVTDEYVRVAFNTELTLSYIRDNMSLGVDPTTRQLRRTLFGLNGINVRIKNPFELLLDEVLHPFYIFQVMSIIVWCLSEYYFFSALILVSSGISALTSLIETRKNLLNLRDMAQHSCMINRYYGSEYERINSDNLVCGDLIELENDMTIPCDILLLSGECIMNESMLTGESIPVVKQALYTADDLDHTIYKGNSSLTLFAGTKVLQTKLKGKSDKVQGICVRSGFETAKGKLVLSILYPRPSEFTYYRDAFRFVGILASISIIGMIYCVIRYSIMGVDGIQVFLRAANLVTIAIPPALPVAITVGTAIAVSRLSGKKIFTISPSRVNVAGKINCMCFDKTGTLTEDGLHLNSIHLVENSRFKDEVETDELYDFVEANSQRKDDVNSIFLYCMVSCHSLVEHCGRIIGDPLEQEIFTVTKWELNDPDSSLEKYKNALAIVTPPNNRSYNRTSTASAEVGILKRFEFSSDLKRMSVIIKDYGWNETYALVKGSPEHLKELCVPSSIPNNFDSKLFEYTYRGFRVISMAYKRVPAEAVSNYSREQIESDLIFIGFAIMQNKMKIDTPSTIAELSDAKIDNIMVTGDNALTGVYIAKESGIITTPAVYLGDVDGGFVRWRNVEHNTLELDPETLEPPHEESHIPFSLALTGAAFQSLLKDHYANIDETKPVKKLQINLNCLFYKVLVTGRVYARMSPDQKRVLSEELQKIDYFVGFCGDGANDTGSLKASHVGVSLSQEEASIAAPFTSLNPSIASVPIVIKEGRASLSTSFQVFKFMAFYSLVQFFVVLLLYERNTTLGNFQVW
jgi:cation-transporting ATPase 13A2